jgi:hypothetical protein
MGNMPLRERFVLFGAQDDLTRIVPDNVRFR